MLILLPPSETKRDGGAGSPLALDRLRFPSLNPVRREVVDAVVTLAADRDAAVRALKLGPKQAGEVDRNRAIPSSPPDDGKKARPCAAQRRGFSFQEQGEAQVFARPSRTSSGQGAERPSAKIMQTSTPSAVIRTSSPQATV